MRSEPTVRMEPASPALGRRTNWLLLAVLILLGVLVTETLLLWPAEVVATVPPTTPPPRPVVEGLERIGKMEYPAIREASALIKSRRHPGVFWTLCDAGNPPHLFAVETSGKT